MAKSKDYKELKQALLDNLEARGMVEKMYLDKVDEYMDLYEQRKMLNREVEEQGVWVYDPRRQVNTENRAIMLGVNVGKHMLSIYKALGFTADAVQIENEQEDDSL